jgi:hypothetical protein
LMAARRCANPDCGHDLSGFRPQAKTCSTACRVKVHRESRASRPDVFEELQDIAWRLVRQGEIAPADAVWYTAHPTPGILDALHARREAVAA